MNDNLKKTLESYQLQYCSEQIRCMKRSENDN